MTPGQRGSVIGGIWLVSVGAVFLVQQVMGLPWSQAWPLFLVMAGVGTGASALVGLAGRPIGAWSVIWALVWPGIMIAVGLLLFVDLAGLADVDALDLLLRWWPAILIVIGVLILTGAVWPRGRGVEDRVSIPTGGVSSGEVTLKFGAGRLEVGRGVPGTLVDGTFEGGVLRRDLGPGRVELEADVTRVFPWMGDTLHWQVGLAPDLPLALRLEGGASRSILELADLQVTTLAVKTGASDTRIVLPAAVSECEVRVEAGAAQVTIEVPAGVAARIRSQMGLGSTNVDEGRFPRTADGWASPDYEGAAHRAEISIQGGVGSVRVR
jgi:hypothetical protein